MAILSRQDLDKITEKGCQKPGCDCGGRLFLHARCHPKAGTWASYENGSGQLVLTCRKCRRPIAVVAVASLEPDRN